MSSNIQPQLDNKQQTGDYVTTSVLSTAETELQAEIAASVTAITTEYTTTS